jgi:hypothetical protein
VIKHNLFSNIFVAAVAAACFIHGTWTIATITGGNQPILDTLSVSAVLQWLFWVIPGALVSFALDIGQFQTSVEIAKEHSEGRYPVLKYITFFVISLFVYYLQWFHLVHHMPALALSESVLSSTYADTVTSIRMAIIWIYPALLPVTILLYTYSQNRKPAASAAATPATFGTAIVTVPKDDASALQPVSSAGSLFDFSEAPENIVVQPVASKQRGRRNGQFKE